MWWAFPGHGHMCEEKSGQNLFNLQSQSFEEENILLLTKGQKTYLRGGNGFRCHCLRRIWNIVDFCLPKDFGPKMTTLTPAAPFSYFRCIKENLRISYWNFSQRKVTNAISLKKSDEDFLIAPSEDFEERTFECAWHVATLYSGIICLFKVPLNLYCTVETGGLVRQWPFMFLKLCKAASEIDGTYWVTSGVCIWCILCILLDLSEIFMA